MIPERMVLPVAQIAVSLGNHLWQSTVVAGIVCILALVLRNNRPSLRHALWTIASLKFLFPFSLLVGFGTILPKPFTLPPKPHLPVYAALQAATQPFNEQRPLVSPDHHRDSTTLSQRFCLTH